MVTEKLYLSEDDMIDAMIGIVYKTPSLFEFIRQDTADPVVYSVSLGRMIRNKFNLWDQDNPYTDDALNSPDAVSDRVIRAV
jgi:hypothetical protein